MNPRQIDCYLLSDKRRSPQTVVAPDPIATRSAIRLGNESRPIARICRRRMKRAIRLPRHSRLLRQSLSRIFAARWTGSAAPSNSKSHSEHVSACDLHGIPARAVPCDGDRQIRFHIRIQRPYFVFRKRSTSALNCSAFSMKAKWLTSGSIRRPAFGTQSASVPGWSCLTVSS